MSKLKLHLEALAVESFDTGTPSGEKGTVFGEQQCTCPGVTCAVTCAATCAYTCDDATCPRCPTCAATCAQTCDGETCDWTCAAQFTCDLSCDTCP